MARTKPTPATSSPSLPPAAATEGGAKTGWTDAEKAELYFTIIVAGGPIPWAALEQAGALKGRTAKGCQRLIEKEKAKLQAAGGVVVVVPKKRGKAEEAKEVSEDEDEIGSPKKKKVKTPRKKEGKDPVGSNV